MTEQFRATLAQAFRGFTRIQREEIFGEHNAKYLPLNLSHDAHTMFPGYVGREFRRGQGIVVLAINPGGGGDAYTVRSAEDEVLYPLLVRLNRAPGAEILAAFEDVNAVFDDVVRRWNLWRILGPTLDAASVSLPESAFLNCVPYRTRGDKMPPVAARSAAWEGVVAPALDLLQPLAVIALGRKAGGVVDRFASRECHTFCVPRTIGDSWVSAEAAAVHERIREELA